MKPQESKPRISPSMLAMLVKCPRQAYYSYIENLRQPPGVAMLVGRATHDAVEDDLRNKIENKELLTDEEVGDIAASYLEMEWERSGEVHLQPDERSRGAQAVKGESKDRAVTLSLLHHSEIAPKLRPLTVEERFDIRIDGCAHDLSGKLDVKEGGGDKRPWRSIRDTKTKAKTPPAGEVFADVQLQAYALAVELTDKVKPKRIGRTYLVSLKRGAKAIEEDSPPPQDYTPLLQRIATASALLEAGVFMPCDPNHWACSERFCGYWKDVCPFGRRARTMVAQGG